MKKFTAQLLRRLAATLRPLPKRGGIGSAEALFV
jgi:hypothetical protein